MLKYGHFHRDQIRNEIFAFAVESVLLLSHQILVVVQGGVRLIAVQRPPE